MFNPNPRIEAIPISGRHTCYVIDDALRDPQHWVDYAINGEDLKPSANNAYPGPELRMPDAISTQLDRFFASHVRRLLGARRTLRMYSRLSLTTTPSDQLEPRQWLCHVDRLEVEPGQRLAASVLYLFQDATLGGTSFYMPRRPLPEIAALVQDSATLPADTFAAKYGLRSCYMTESNAYFEKVLTVPARWNRLIFYDGSVFHSGDIAHPERLSADPKTGRLTLNGFFICQRALAG